MQGQTRERGIRYKGSAVRPNGRSEPAKHGLHIGSSLMLTQYCKGTPNSLASFNRAFFSHLQTMPAFLILLISTATALRGVAVLALWHRTKQTHYFAGHRPWMHLMQTRFGFFHEKVGISRCHISSIVVSKIVSPCSPLLMRFSRHTQCGDIFVRRWMYEGGRDVEEMSSAFESLCRTFTLFIVPNYNSPCCPPL